jgi:hypothetical protein
MTTAATAALAREFNVTHRPDGTDHMVTVAQLRAALADFPDDAFVVLAKDPEGNGFSPLARNSDHSIAAGLAWYLPNSTWSGEIANYSDDPDPDDEDDHLPESGDLLAVVLDPVN